MEKLDNDHIDAMSVHERFAVAAKIFDEAIEKIEQQIRLEDPDVSDRELKLRTAEIMYKDDPGAQRLLKMAREEGPD